MYHETKHPQLLTATGCRAELHADVIPGLRVLATSLHRVRFRVMSHREGCRILCVSCVVHQTIAVTLYCLCFALIGLPSTGVRDLAYTAYISVRRRSLQTITRSIGKVQHRFAAMRM